MGYMEPDSYGRAVAVTPHDSNNLAAVSKALYIGGAAAGDLAVVMEDGSTVTFDAVPVGTLLKIRVQRVNNTDTTATNILALYYD